MESETQLNHDGCDSVAHGDMVIAKSQADTCDNGNAPEDTTATTNEDQPEELQCCPTPAFPETALATDVASLLREYLDLNGEITDITTDALNQAAELEDSKDKLRLLLAHMQSVLSQRGDLNRRLKGDELPSEISAELLTQIEALPGWTKWYENYRLRVKSAVSLRTVQRQLAELNRMSLPVHIEADEHDGDEDSEGTEGGVNTDGAEDGEEPEDGAGTEDNSGERASVNHGTDESERVEIKSTQELLTEFARRMLDALNGQSIKNESMRIACAVGLVKDLLRAIDEGKLIEPPSCGVVPPSPLQPPVIDAPVPASDAVEANTHDLESPVDELNGAPVSDADADDAVEFTVAGYCGEFAVWEQPTKPGDMPFNILPTREEAKAQAAILAAGGSVCGMTARKRPASAKLQSVSSERSAGGQGS